MLPMEMCDATSEPSATATSCSSVGPRAPARSLIQGPHACNDASASPHLLGHYISMVTNFFINMFVLGLGRILQKSLLHHRVSRTNWSSHCHPGLASPRSAPGCKRVAKGLKRIISRRFFNPFCKYVYICVGLVGGSIRNQSSRFFNPF